MASREVEGIVRTPGVCGGRARISGTRIPVWSVHAFHKNGVSFEQMLDAYPHLSEEQLLAAGSYIARNRAEIEQDLKDNS